MFVRETHFGLRRKGQIFCKLYGVYVEQGTRRRADLTTCEFSLHETRVVERRRPGRSQDTICRPVGL